MVPLVALPVRMAQQGFYRVEICHFHIEDTSSEYLARLKDAFEQVGVTIQSVLIDDGDVSSQDCGERDAAWIGGWIDVAAKLGAERARVIAGKSEFSREAFERSVAKLKPLASRGADQGVRMTTENWFPLLSTPDAVLEMLDRLEGNLGLCADFGNWAGPDKYEALTRIYPQAETCHAKCEFSDAHAIDVVDYGRCLLDLKASGFDGPLVLVNGGPDHEWNALDLTREAISQVWS